MKIHKLKYSLNLVFRDEKSGVFYNEEHLKYKRNPSFYPSYFLVFE